MSHDGYSVNHPCEQKVHVYHSEDGQEFAALKDAPLEINGNGAELTKAGFVVVGAGPDVITCD